MELLGFPGGKLGPAVISRIDSKPGDYYENTYPRSDSLRSDIRRSNRYARDQCPVGPRPDLGQLIESAANWTPSAVPDGPADTATFGLSNTTDVSISANTEVNSIVFTPAATNPYTITASPGLTLTISGVGIVNNSGATQNFVTAVDPSGNFGQIVFTNSATAGTATFTNNGSAANFVLGGETTFFGTSTAANGTFVNNGGTGFSTGGGFTVFHDSSTAGNANFINRSGIGESTSATIFGDSSSAANGTFTNEGGGAGGQPFAEERPKQSSSAPPPRLMAPLLIMAQRPRAGLAGQRSLTTAQPRAVACLLTTEALPAV